MIVRGEAGVGKTAVLERFADHARSVADVPVGRCDRLSTPLPLGPLVDVAATVHAAEPFALELARDWWDAVAAWERLERPYDAAPAWLAGDVPALLQAREALEPILAKLGVHSQAEAVRSLSTSR